MVTAAGSAKTYVAADVAEDGDVAVFWSEAGNVVYASRFDGSSWSAPAAWSNSIAGIRGIACANFGDWSLAICGQEESTLDSKVWVTLYGDGAVQAVDTWSALLEITTAAADSEVEFYDPGLALAAVWRLFFVEFYAGTVQSVRVHRAEQDIGGAFDSPTWTEPAAFDFDGSFGVAAAARNLGGYVWLSAPAGVWRSRLPAHDDLDVTADVVEAAVELDPDEGRVRLTLRNDARSAAGPAGQYNGYGGGALGALQRGTRLTLSPGYMTEEGPESTDAAGFGPSYWVESVEMVTGARPRLVVHARDGWWLLERWRARRQYVWAAGSASLSVIVSYVCARAGVQVVSGGDQSAAWTALLPAFTIHPGESAKTAVRRLLSMVPDVAYFQGGNLAVREATADESAVYAFGVEHAIVEARLRDIGGEANRLRVVGLGVFDEGFDFGEIESLGERVEQVVDLNVASGEGATDRAAFGLRRQEMRARRDELTLFGVSCGQEMYDVVEVTAAQAGLDAARRRVLGLRWRYDTGATPRYEMTLRLGMP